MTEGAALAGRGKRAAFALFYGPLHYLLIREIVRAIGPAAMTRTTKTAVERIPMVLDAGCGTGAAGAAFALACAAPPRILAVDRSAWALEEAAWTYRTFQLPARVRRSGLVPSALPESPMSFLAAFSMNELDEAARDALLPHLLQRAARGDRILIVEPLAGFVAPWWQRWQDACLARRGRADEWRFRLDLPAVVAKLDRAAGLDHRELTGRSLWLGE